MINKLNIPAVLVHKIGNKTYHVNGSLLSINESTDTCTMRFRGNIVEKNIPLSSVMINEGFLDKIKEYGKRIASYVVTKVKGFVVAVDEVTKKVLSWSFFNVYNMYKNIRDSKTPGITMVPCEALKKEIGGKHPTLDDAFAVGVEEEKKEIEKFWTRVIQRAGTTDDSMYESIQYVKKKYYKPLTPLNEGIIYSLNNVKFGVPTTGQTVTSEELKIKLKSNIIAQISPKDSPEEWGYTKVRQEPIIIWGAPGIGKTSIVKQAISSLLKEDDEYNFNFIYSQLSNTTIESWTLPTVDTTNIATYVQNRESDTDDLNSIEKLKSSAEKYERFLLKKNKTFTDVPPKWVPAYENSPDFETNIERDKHYARSEHLSGGALTKNKYGEIEEYNAGVIFFDEYSRIPSIAVQAVIMGMINERKFAANFNISSKWAFVFAANRYIDEFGQEDINPDNFFFTAAKQRRLIQCTFVPTKAEWLQWARQIDPNTGEANISPWITDIIAGTEDYVWYTTVDNHGYDDYLEKFGIQLEDLENATDEEDLKNKLEKISRGSRSMTPAQWEMIDNVYKSELYRLFGYDKVRELTKQSEIIKQDKKTGKLYTYYYGGIHPDILSDELNDLDDDTWEKYWKDHGGDKMNHVEPDATRYEKFMKHIIMHNVLNQYGSVDAKDWESTNAPMIAAVREYLYSGKEYTADVCGYIWNHGTVPLIEGSDQFQKDDDFTAATLDKYQKTTYCKWKSFTPTQLSVLERIWNSYPGLEDQESGSIDTLYENLLEAAEDRDKTFNLEEIKKLGKNLTLKNAKDLDDEYSVMIGSQKVSILFPQTTLDNTDIDALKVTIYLIQKYEVVRQLLNYFKYVVKVALQIPDTQNILKAANDRLYDLLRKPGRQQNGCNKILNTAGATKANNNYKLERTETNFKQTQIEAAKSLIQPVEIYTAYAMNAKKDLLSAAQYN